MVSQVWHTGRQALGAGQWHWSEWPKNHICTDIERECTWQPAEFGHVRLLPKSVNNLHIPCWSEVAGESQANYSQQYFNSVYCRKYTFLELMCKLTSTTYASVLAIILPDNSQFVNLSMRLTRETKLISLPKKSKSVARNNNPMFKALSLFIRLRDTHASQVSCAHYLFSCSINKIPYAHYKPNIRCMKDWFPCTKKILKGQDCLRTCVLSSTGMSSEINYENWNTVFLWPKL